MAKRGSESGLFLILCFGAISVVAAALPTRERQLYPFDRGETALLAGDLSPADEFSDVPRYTVVRTLHDANRLVSRLIPRRTSTVTAPTDPQDPALSDAAAPPPAQDPALTLIEPDPGEPAPPPGSDLLAPRTISLPSIPGLGFLGFSVPEPSTWLMLIAGFLLIGGDLRRTKRIAGSAQLHPVACDPK